MSILSPLCAHVPNPQASYVYDEGNTLHRHRRAADVHGKRQQNSAVFDATAQRQSKAHRLSSFCTSVTAALGRPIKAAVLATGAIGIVGLTMPQVGLALWAAAPAYQLGVACACYAAAFALTFAAPWVQTGVASAFLGSTLGVALCPGPMGARLFGGAAAGMVGVHAIAWLFKNWQFLILCSGLLAMLIIFDQKATAAR